jgi:hypothetical protein
MATTRKTSRDPFSRPRDQFREAVAALDPSVPQGVSQALRSLAAALEYEDRPLIRSHLETAYAAMTEALGEAIEKRLDWSRSIRAHFRRLATEVGGSPSEEFDEVGRFVAGELDKIIRALTDLRDGPIREMNSSGAAVPGENELEAELGAMTAFKASLIGGWPWSNLPMPASDPAMLARARAGTERGQGVPIEELIREIEAAD